MTASSGIQQQTAMLSLGGSPFPIAEPSIVVSTAQFEEEKSEAVVVFEKWAEADQSEFVQLLLSKMSHCQHSQINSYLKPMLQRDFISLLPSEWTFSCDFVVFTT